MNLVEIRRKKGLKQEEVARIVGMSRAGYSNIETGKRRPSVDVARKIAAALGFEWTRFYDDGNGSPDAPTISPEHAAFAAAIGFPGARRLVV